MINERVFEAGAVRFPAKGCLIAGFGKSVTAMEGGRQ
jgi:hypothetical protein